MWARYHKEKGLALQTTPQIDGKWLFWEMMRIFEHAIKALGVENASQIVFLDDLGGNLKAAKEMGLRTIKVPVHDAPEAVRQLEEMLGENLSLPSSKL
ncbi:hypothetical protein H072_1696 [Dactylellina haptotyla CBS 200.50]|uniref:Uncharacterized protein n=1 Tax=Dactylellina haptotyla (strain CBS 200.50) TaxID=1284197 RepID=S8AN25_DACHA|nr:hypothetical protein H072_1696 [Dactylellina haptotyla CBS 200.50]